MSQNFVLNPEQLAEKEELESKLLSGDNLKDVLDRFIDTDIAMRVRVLKADSIYGHVLKTYDHAVLLRRKNDSKNIRTFSYYLLDQQNNVVYSTALNVDHLPKPDLPGSLSLTEGGELSLI